MCNLAEIHLNQIDPYDFVDQERAFKAGALSVAALLNHDFSALGDRYQKSRELDPIVAVCPTGIFDFFVKAFGVDWLKWWEAGRPKNWGDDHTWFPFRDTSHWAYARRFTMPASEYFTLREQEYLTYWRQIVERTVKDYCDRHGLKTPNRSTALQPSGCGSRELLRIFDQGLIYADEIMEDGEGEVKGLTLSVRGGVKVETGIANEPLQLLKITLNNGRVLRLTPNHRLSVLDEWVRADELIVGMPLDFSLGHYKKTEEADLKPIDLTAYAKYNKDLPLGEYRQGYLVNISLPERMSPELAYFLGAMFGNGCCGSRNGTKRVRFAHGSLDILNKISEISFKLFGIKGCISESSCESKKLELSIASKPLYDWLEANDLLKTVKSKELDRIPQILRRSSRESILSFFCGMIDTDGCIRKEGSLSIDSSSEKFLRNLQQIGEAIGLSFSIGLNSKGQNHQEVKEIWFLGLSRMTSDPDAIAYINDNSYKAMSRPIPPVTNSFRFNPYSVKSVEYEDFDDYSFDVAVSGVDDDDSWYWQGAIKSHNTKSLLTGASPGFHPPKAAYMIRRITVRKNHPVAFAAIALGYSVLPSQADKDENGVLLNDPFDPRVTEWLIEIPMKTVWAEQEGCADIDVSKFSAVAQFDFYMQVQKYYTRHNSSATLEMREDEIEPLAKCIYSAIQNDDGYISAALLARFDDVQTFPRLPFEPIDRTKYQELEQAIAERKAQKQIALSFRLKEAGIDTYDFDSLYKFYDQGDVLSPETAACDTGLCEMKETLEQIKSDSLTVEIL